MIYRRIQRVLSRVVVTYGVAAVLLFVLADYKKACARRLNTLDQWGQYPMLIDKKSIAFSQGGLRKAVHYYKILAEGFPQLDQPYGMVGYCYWLSGDKNLAIKYYQEAKKRRSDGYWYDYNLGVLYGDLEDKEKALVFFKNIVECDSRELVDGILLTPLTTLSKRERQHFYDLAVEFAQQIRDLSWRNIIKINFDRRNYEKVTTMALMADRDSYFKDKTAVWVYAGAAAYMAGQFKIALGFFAAALEQQPDQIWAMNFVALTKSRLDGGDPPDDKNVLKKFFEDPVLFPTAMGKAMLHPWSNEISPGKESLL